MKATTNDLEENRKAHMFESMAGVIAANYDGFVLRKNIPGYPPQTSDERIESVGIYRRHILVGVRLVDANCTAAELLQDICGVLRGAIERTEM